MFHRLFQKLQKNARLQTIYYLKHQINDAFQKKEFQSARDCLGRILHLDPDTQDAWVALSFVLLKQGQLDEGLGVLQKTKAYHPHYPRALLQFVQAYRDRGSLVPIAHVLSEAIEEMPTALNLRVYWAENLVQQAKLKEAEDELKIILGYDPYHLQALIGLTYCYIGAGNKKSLRAD